MEAKTNLAQVVKAAGKRAATVARDLGINYKSFHAYMHGTRNPKRPARMQIAAYFGKHPTEIFPE